MCLENNDVVFILDSSGSLGATNFEKMKKFVAELIQNMDNIQPTRGRAAIITFSSSARLEIRLGEYRQVSEMEQAVCNNVSGDE